MANRVRPRDEATEMIGRYIDRFYNPARRHSALAFMSPVQYEMTVTVRENDPALFRGKSKPWMGQDGEP